MSEPTPQGHPAAVMAVGGLIGGLVAGGNNAALVGSLSLTLAASYALLFALGHIRKESWDQSLGTLIGLSTTIPLPCGFVGFLLGKAMWGNP
jgi:hypothetical protein